MKRSILLLSIVSGCTAFAAAPPSASDRFRLRYFDIRGAAEGIRLIFALAGEEYDDDRWAVTPGKFESPGFDEAKGAGELVSNLNRAPVLVTPDGVSIGQSKAIERFLARRFGLMGRDDVESALIDCISEHCRDVKDAMMRKRFSAFVRDRTDEEKAASKAEWFDEEMPELLAKIEAAVVANGSGSTRGVAVGSALSYADLCIYSMLKEGFPAYREDTLAAAKDCPKLLEICENCASNPKLSKWIEERPVTNM